MSIIPNAYRKSLDQREDDIDALIDQKREIEEARKRCRDACAHELTQFAKECARGGGNPGLDLATGGLDDLLADIQYDSIAEIDRQIMEASTHLSVEYRKQGVA